MALQELLYGFIMALIFVAATQFGLVRFDSNMDLVMTIIGMNTAWGLVDMIVFTLVDRFDQRKYVRIVESKSEISDDIIEELISNELSGTLIDVLDKEDERKIVRQILEAGLEPEEHLKRERGDMLRTNFMCFVLTMLTCIPVITPLLIISDIYIACLWSSAVSTVFLFMIGYFLEEYTGINRWIMGLLVAGIGIGITFMAVALGG